MLLILYWVMTTCCCLYACLAGNGTGRIGSIVVVVKTVAGFYAGLFDQSWGRTAYPILAVDMMCLAAFLTIALRSDRFWPLWATACSLAAVVVHIASIAQIGLSPVVYQGLKDLWAIAMELFMVRGIALDVRHQRTHDRAAAKPI